ncbi:unnamed protein product [Rodentolepis nana]|uniref:HECT domain-containing protein n=1 Tax=Rodentolepis nana TaxID=102285 RepID=A0A158QI54_RODNA|nr:unnamed protein product [Rodentolepis nana]
MPFFLYPSPPSEQTIVQVVEAIVTLSSQNSEMLPHFLNFLRHLFFTVVELDIGVSVPTLPNHQTRESNDFESKGISPRSIGLLHPILPYLKSYLHFEGSTYDAEDNASFSRTRLPLQPLGQVRIHVARFLCHLLFHCRGEDGAEIVERIGELDFIGDLTMPSTPPSEADLIRIQKTFPVLARKRLISTKCHVVVFHCDLFFAFKWNSLMHATLHFFTRMILRRGFNYSPIAPSTFLNAGVNNNNASLSANSGQSCNERQQQQVDDGAGAASPYKSPNHLNPYAKIVHQSDVLALSMGQVIVVQLNPRSKFIPDIASYGNVSCSIRFRGRPGYRRPGYLGHLQEIAVQLSSYLLPDEFDYLGISVRDYDMAIVEDEDHHWQVLQDRRQRRRSEKIRQMESGGKVIRGFSVDELLSDEEEERLLPRVVLRMQLLKDLPTQDFANFVEFVSGELRQVVSVSNVEHLRDLKSALVSAPNPSRFILTDSTPSIEAATEAYEKYKNEPLVRTFSEVFGRDEKDFDPLVKCVEDRVESMFQGLFATLVLPEDTRGAPLFNQIANTVIRAPDGVEVGDASAGFPLEFVEGTFKEGDDNDDDDANPNLSPIRHTSPITLQDSDNLHEEKQRERLEELERNFFSRSRESLLNVFEEAHLEVLMECDEDSQPPSSSDSENSEPMEIDFFQPALSLSPMERSRESSGSTLDEGDGERGRGDLVREMEDRLSLIPKPTKSDGRPTMSVGRSKRFHHLTGPRSDSFSPPDDRWSPPTSRSLGVLNSPDLPDSDSLILPRFNSVNTLQTRESLPRPIQPTMRSHRLARSSSKTGDSNPNRVSNALQDSGRRKRLVTPLDFEDGEVKF